MHKIRTLGEVALSEQNTLFRNSLWFGWRHLGRFAARKPRKANLAVVFLRQLRVGLYISTVFSDDLFFLQKSSGNFEKKRQKRRHGHSWHGTLARCALLFSRSDAIPTQPWCSAS